MASTRAVVTLGTVIVVAVGLGVLIAAHENGSEQGEPPPATSSPTATASTAEPETREPRVPDDALLPNMRSRDAYDFQVEGAGDDRVLRFAAALSNLGPGPMLIEPLGRGVCSAGQLQVRQVLHRDRNGNGTFDRRRDSQTSNRRSGCMLRHPTHDHWHFDAMASYTLRVARTDVVVSQRRKVSFCLRDNERVPGRPIQVRRSYFGDCTAESGQGISPGWSDIYGPDLDGQSLPLPGRHDGKTLCLDLAADPRDRLIETIESDNAVSVAIRVQGDGVRRVTPAPCRV